MTVAEALQNAADRLKSAGVPESMLDAEYLVADALDIRGCACPWNSNRRCHDDITDWNSMGKRNRGISSASATRYSASSSDSGTPALFKAVRCILKGFRDGHRDVSS